MSEKGQAEQAPSMDEIPEIAAQYLNASDEAPEHQERLNEIELELDELRSTRREVVNDVGEDHYLIEDVDADIQELEGERQDLQESTEDVAQLRKDILRAAAEDPGFRLNEHWLNSKTIQALTHALYGTEEEKLVLADQELRTPDDARELDRMQKFQIKRDIVHLARDQLGDDERVVERWKEFEESRARPAFPVIANKPGVGPSEIAEACDKTSSTVRNWTSDLSGQDILKMVYTPKQGDYHLSTVGKYYAAHYADLDETDETEVAEDEEDTEAESSEEATEMMDSEEDDSEQVDLGNLDKTPEAQSGGPSDTGQGALSEAETTEEKAEALFDDVSETRRADK